MYVRSEMHAMERPPEPSLRQMEPMVTFGPSPPLCKRVRGYNPVKFFKIGDAYAGEFSATST
jgi:hypothetical protein